MKTTLYFTLTLLTFVTFAFVPNSLAQDASPEYVARVIYFVPNDREPDPNMDEKLDIQMKDAQQFYADQMEVHGFGRKTFRLETDDGNAKVHQVNGKFSDAYYLSTPWMVWGEIEEQFDMSKNIYYLALDTTPQHWDSDHLVEEDLVVLGLEIVIADVHSEVLTVYSDQNLAKLRQVLLLKFDRCQIP